MSNNNDGMAGMAGIAGFITVVAMTLAAVIVLAMPHIFRFVFWVTKKTTQGIIKLYKHIQYKRMVRKTLKEQSQEQPQIQ